MTTGAPKASPAIVVDDGGSWRARVEVTKRDDVQMRLFGVAMTATDATGAEVVDHQNQVISPDDMAEAAYDWAANSGRSGVYHRPTDPGFVDQAGHMICSVPLTAEIRKAMGVEPGPATWFVGIQITDPAVWARYASGELPEFSIRGSAVLEDA